MGWKRYFDYLEILPDDDSGQRELGFSELSIGSCKGEEPFIKESFKNVTEKESASAGGRQPGVKLSELSNLRELKWDPQLKEYADDLDIDMGNLGSKKSSIQKLKLAYLMKHSGSVTNAW